MPHFVDVIRVPEALSLCVSMLVQIVHYIVVKKHQSGLTITCQTEGLEDPKCGQRPLIWAPPIQVHST
jgi:hypothetical protein